jgi:hypothetical protein
LELLALVVAVGVHCLAEVVPVGMQATAQTEQGKVQVVAVAILETVVPGPMVV